MAAPKQPCEKCGSETKFLQLCKGCDWPVRYQPPKKKELELPIKKRIKAALVETGHVNAWIHDIDNRMMKTGLGTGTSDIICVVLPYGRFLAIEVKRPGYSPSDVRPAQRCFLDVVRKFGGVSGIATSEAEALALLTEARQPLKSDAT